MIRALLSGVYSRAPDFWKLPHKRACMMGTTSDMRGLGMLIVKGKGFASARGCDLQSDPSSRTCHSPNCRAFKDDALDRILPAGVGV